MLWVLNPTAQLSTVSSALLNYLANSLTESKSCLVMLFLNVEIIFEIVRWLLPNSKAISSLPFPFSQERITVNSRRLKRFHTLFYASEL